MFLSLTHSVIFLFCEICQVRRYTQRLAVQKRRKLRLIDQVPAADLHRKRCTALAACQLTDGVGR